MSNNKKTSTVWALDVLKTRVNQLKIKIFELGLASGEFINIMKSILKRVLGQSKLKSIKKQQDIYKALCQSLKFNKNHKSLIIDLITEVDVMYGNFDSSEDQSSQKNVHNKRKQNNKESINIIESQSDGFVKLEYSNLIKKEADLEDKNLSPKELVIEDFAEF